MSSVEFQLAFRSSPSNDLPSVEIVDDDDFPPFFSKLKAQWATEHPCLALQTQSSI